MFDATKLIGLSKLEAFQVLEAAHVKHRVVKTDGVPRVVTRDLISDRVNLEIEAERVVAVRLG